MTPIDPGQLNDSLASMSFDAGSSTTSTARLSDKKDEPRVRIDDGATRTALEKDRDPEAALASFIENLLSPEHSDSQPHLMAIGYELEALVSIYSPSAVRLSITSRPPSWNPELLADLPPIMAPPSTNSDSTKDQAKDGKTIPSSISMTGRHSRQGSQAWQDALKDFNSGLIPTERIRYEVTIPAWEQGEKLQGVEDKYVPDEPPNLRVLVSLPPTYPNSSPPQLQLLGRYLGSFPIDSGLFGDITRTYISSSGVTFTPGDVCVFEGLTHVQSLSRNWYAQNLKEDSQNDQARDAERTERTERVERTKTDSATSQPDSTDMSRPSPSRANFSYTHRPDHDDANTPSAVKNAERGKPSGLKIISSEPIVEKKSTFVGHAVRVTDEREVPLVVHELLSDRKIAKAAHPAIFAYRIAKEVGGPAGKVYNTDYDDDGESQAGSRLQHLLGILELENVLVVVTRWYGGTLLGPDRFKLINQAARDALELGGFLDGEKEKDGQGGKGKGKKK